MFFRIAIDIKSSGLTTDVTLNYQALKMNLYFWSREPIEGLGLSRSRRADHDVEKGRPILDGQGRAKGRLDLVDRGTEVAFGQFHQHFTISFCANILAPKKYKPKPKVQKSCSKDFCMKKLLKKCWWNWHLEGRTSPSFSRNEWLVEVTLEDCKTRWSLSHDFLLTKRSF